MKASTRTSVFVSKEDSEALYENMDKDGIEKAFRELLVLEDSSVRKITSYSWCIKNNYLDKDYLQGDVEAGTSLEYKRELLRGGSVIRPLLSKTSLGQIIVQNPDYLTSDKRTKSFIEGLSQYMFALSYSNHE